VFQRCCKRCIYCPFARPCGKCFYLWVSTWCKSHVYTPLSSKCNGRVCVGLKWLCNYHCYSSVKCYVNTTFQWSCKCCICYPFYMSVAMLFVHSFAHTQMRHLHWVQSLCLLYVLHLRACTIFKLFYWPSKLQNCTAQQHARKILFTNHFTRLKNVCNSFVYHIFYASIVLPFAGWNLSANFAFTSRFTRFFLTRLQFVCFLTQDHLKKIKHHDISSTSPNYKTNTFKNLCGRFLPKFQDDVFIVEKYATFEHTF